jgi:hypothetical protein
MEFWTGITAIVANSAGQFRRRAYLCGRICGPRDGACPVPVGNSRRLTGRRESGDISR